MTVRRFTNWVGNVVCTCDSKAPRSLDQLCESVRSASSSGRVRAAGGGYSWAPLVPNDGTILRMRHLRRPLAYDEKARTLEVECGMTVGQVTRLAAARGMTLRSPTLYPNPTIGGAISTGSHGTDSRVGNFADSIVGMQIVDYTGEVRRLGSGDADLQAARVALGALGVIYAVTLQLDPQCSVSIDIRSVPVKRFLAEFEDLQKRYEFLEFFWFPFQENIWIYAMDKTAVPADRRGWWARTKTDVKTFVEDVSARGLLPWIAMHAPGLTPALNTIASRLAFEEGLSVRKASDAFHLQKSYAKCWDLEYAVPANEGSRAWAEAISLVQHYAKQGLYPVNLAVHGRFTGASCAWIAPDYGRPTCYVEVLSAKGTPRWEIFFREMEREWCRIKGARPHWGKLYWQRDRIAAQYREMNQFLDVRQRWDPNRVFLNPFLEHEIFQLPVQPERASRGAGTRAASLGSAARSY